MKQLWVLEQYQHRKLLSSWWGGVGGWVRQTVVTVIPEEI